MWFLFGEVSCHGGWDGLRYFIVVLPEPSIYIIILMLYFLIFVSFFDETSVSLKCNRVLSGAILFAYAPR